MDQLISNYPEYFALIRYHVWWPGANDPYYRYNTNEVIARTNYYGVTGVPQLQLDGAIDGGSYPSFWRNIQIRGSADSPIEITLGGTFDPTSRTGNLNMRFVGTDFIDWTNLKVRVALTESDINWNAPNGINIHHQTFRDMVPNDTGANITIDFEDTVTMAQAFACPTPIVWENSELLVWVQSDMVGSKEILQTARIYLAEMPVTGIEDGVNLPASFDLDQNYPNPFNASTQIAYSLPTQSDVQLVIYDLAGREVTRLDEGIKAAGNYQVIWDGTNSANKPVSSGVYFYSLQTRENSITRRMVLLK